MRFRGCFTIWLILGVTALGCRGQARTIARPPGPIPGDAATRYVLDLINQDRAAEDLPPVEWDEDAAKGAQRHADDMAHHGFTAHWGTDGSVPEQRYTEGGGRHMDQENAACFFDGKLRELDRNSEFLATELEKIELAFISELPPNDGHRKNILKPWHTHVGVGLAKPQGVQQLCMAQEFTDRYAELDELPIKLAKKTRIRIAGTVEVPVEFGGVGLGWAELPRPLSVEHLNSTSSYRIPEPDTLYFAAGYQTPKPVRVEGNRFEIELDIGEKGAGLYRVSVWGRFPDEEALSMISLRTVLVE